MNDRLTIIYIFIFGLLLLNISCTEETATANQPSNVAPQPQKSNPIVPQSPNKPNIEGIFEHSKNILPKEKITTNFIKCKTNNKTLPENILALPQLGVTAFVGANQSTLDKDLGDSHRVFEVKSAATCEVVFSQTLPINVSADFPYYLAKEACNEEQGWIGIRGFQTATVFEVPTKKLYSDLKPKFATNRPAADATSGMISNLFFDQNYLYGYAVDFGVFAFDMKKNGSPNISIAEYGETQLFGFERGQNQVDLLIPIVTFDENGNLDLNMKNIFERPIRINPALKFKFNNGKFILFKEKGGGGPTNHLVVDMEKKERLQLPEEVAKSSIKEVIAYLR